MLFPPRYSYPEAGSNVPLNLYISKPINAGKALDAVSALEKQVQQWIQRSGKAVRLSDEACANLCFRIKDGSKIVISLRHPRLPESGVVDLYHTLDIGDSATTHTVVLESAVRFAHSLGLNAAPREPQCAAEFFEVVEDDKGEDDLLQFPHIAVSPNLLSDGLVKVTASPYDKYGMVIKNMTDKAFYVSGVFYFDCSDLSIGYHQADKRMIPANGSMSFANDTSYVPWTFYLREGQPRDIGFIKIFVTSAPIDLCGLAQERPFADVSRRVTTLDEEGIRNLLVDTITLVVDQYAPGVVV
ncbi:unnamed protein product [Peniophora sp. CBMAI 1063]|nr:unnamed protein product [Peniophora sp. CBMAI 1063]